MLLGVLLLGLGGRRAILGLVHDVGEVDPLIASLVLTPVLGRVRGSAISLHSNPLLLVCSDQDGRFPVAST